MMYLRVVRHVLAHLCCGLSQRLDLQAEDTVLFDRPGQMQRRRAFCLSVQKSTTTGKPEHRKCTFCYPRIEAGEPTVCSETQSGGFVIWCVMTLTASKPQPAAE
jgi:nitrate reductase beta subunit